MIPWDQVPEGHRRRDYEWGPSTVRVICACRWRSTLARPIEDARRMWVAHIRHVLEGRRTR